MFSLPGLFPSTSSRRTQNGTIRQPYSTVSTALGPHPISPLPRRRQRKIQLRFVHLSSQLPSELTPTSGPLSVLASITGPTEVRIRDELVDRATLEIHVRPLRALSGPSSLLLSRSTSNPLSSPGPAQKAQETLLLSLLSPLILLHLHPRSLIQLTLQTLSSPSTAFSHAFSTDPLDNPLSPTIEGSLGVGSGTAEKAAQVNAAMLALVDAGVECRGMVVGVAVAFVRGEMLLDPSPREEEEARSAHLFVFSFGVGVGGTEGECVGVDSVGRFDEDEVSRVL